MNKSASVFIILAAAIIAFAPLPEISLSDSGITFGVPNACAAADSDGDGMPDAWENRFGDLNPSYDSDGDGIKNLGEYQAGTNPENKDSDDDGISDWDEINLYATNPTLADSDNGGHGDGYEIENGGSPLTPDDDDAPGDAFTLVLRKGWNLISIPVAPYDTEITSVLQELQGQYESVYSNQNGTWLNFRPAFPQISTLSTMEAGYGYWIYMYADTNFRVSGTQPPRCIPLKAGWNLVGFNSASPIEISAALASIEGKYTTVRTMSGGIWQIYDAEFPQISTIEAMKPGLGYWIHMKSAATWCLP